MDYETYTTIFLRDYHKRKRLVEKYRRAQRRPSYDKVSICPECGTETVKDLDRAEIYCPSCGLIVKASIDYVGIYKVSYPFGLLL